MKNYLFAIVVCAAVAVSGCVGYENKTVGTGPSAGSVTALMGNWASASAGIIPSPSSCTDFKWNATEQTSTSAKGTFSATCAGDLKFTGSATGTLVGTVVNWTATATGTTPSIPACAITLAGTAELGVDSIRIPYSGDTCLGKVSGVEILNRR